MAWTSVRVRPATLADLPDLLHFAEELRDRGVTVLLTTHDMAEADRLCRRIAIVDHGQIIALDTPLEPINAADMTFATDNLLAGKLIGQWAKETLGDKAKEAKVAFLDLTPSQPSVDILRDQGFMAGFGIDTKDVNVIGDEDDPRIVGRAVAGITVLSEPRLPIGLVELADRDSVPRQTGDTRCRDPFIRTGLVVREVYVRIVFDIAQLGGALGGDEPQVGAVSALLVGHGA